MATNAKGSFLAVKACLPYLKRSEQPRVDLLDHCGCDGSHLRHRQSLGQVRFSEIETFQSRHFHHLRSLWDCTGNTLLNSEWLGKVNQRSRSWMARIHGIPLHLWSNAVCLQNTREILPWQSGHTFPFPPTLSLFCYCWGICPLPWHLQHGASQAARWRVPAAKDRPRTLRVTITL